MAKLLVWIDTWEAVILIVNSLLASTLNGLIVYLIYRIHSLRSSFNSTILNASIADILVSLNILIFTLETLVENGKNTVNVEWCDYTGFVNLISFVASVMSLAAVSINRYFLVCKNHLYSEVFTKSGTIVYISLVWIISALLSTPPFYGWARFSYHKGKSVCFVDWKSSKSYMLFMILICFCGPITATLVSLYFILKIKRVTEKNLGTDIKETCEESKIGKSLVNMRAKRKERTERKITFSIVIIVLVFFIAWGPFVIVMFLEVFSDGEIPRWLDMGSLLLGCLNSTANPIIYMTVNANFKKALQQCLPMSARRVNDCTVFSQNTIIR